MPFALKFQPPVVSDTELFWMALHSLFMIAAAVGFVLLIVWMAKNLKAKQLLTWTLVLMIAGLLGSFLTFRYEMNLLGKFMWGGSMGGTWEERNSEMMTNGGMMDGGDDMMRNVSMNRMMQMMSQIDGKCTTPECQTEVDNMMMPMMEQMEKYMTRP